MTYRKPTTDAFSSLIKIDSPVGFSYLKRHFDYYAITVTIIEDGTDKSAQEELVDHLIKFVASFSGKIYSMCSSKNNRSSIPSNQR
jgi:putative resolvase